MYIEQTDFVQFVTVKKGLTGGSIKTCRTRLKVFLDWLKDREITPEIIESFIFSRKNLGLQNSSLNSYIFMLRYLTDYCKDRKLVADFGELKSFKKHKKPIVVLTDEEIDQLINVPMRYLPGHTWMPKASAHTCFVYSTIIMFIANTGCRLSEATSLKIEDLDLFAQRATLKETKNQEYRFVYFTDPLTGRLRDLVSGRKPQDFVFTNIRGHPLKSQNVEHDLTKRATFAGITKRVYPHLLRHSYATAEYKATRDIAMTATLLGHKDIKTTYDTYVHLADDVIRQAAYKHPRIRHKAPVLERLESLKQDIDAHDVDQESRFSEEFKKKLRQLLHEEEMRLRFEDKWFNDFLIT